MFIFYLNYLHILESDGHNVKELLKLQKIFYVVIICGYPTNFKKDGNKNYYHVYHVVSLMLTALSISDISEEDLQKELLYWALKWLEDINIIEEQENLSFIDLQDMLDSINLNKTLITYTSVDKLMSDSLERYNEIAGYH